MIPIQINNSFAEEHYENVKDLIVHHINRVLSKGSVKYKRNTYNVSANLRAVLIRLRDLNNNSLKELITKSPFELNNFVSNQNAINSTFININHRDNIVLRNIFISNGYENEKALDKSKFISKIKIDTCPYCNRNYIYTTSKNKKTKPEIDHFYPKSKYPILGFSYFNLIPSCKPCNGFGAKGERDPFIVGLSNPYLLKYNDFELSHKIKNIAIINPLSGKSDIQVYFKKSILGHLEVFNLKDLYELHYDHAIELVIKRNLKYSKKYREYLKSFKTLKFSDSEIDRMILGNYALEKEQHKRPLSKMFQDIGKEIGLI